jgi:hypothetical protein
MSSLLLRHIIQLGNAQAELNAALVKGEAHPNNNDPIRAKITEFQAIVNAELEGEIAIDDLTRSLSGAIQSLFWSLANAEILATIGPKALTEHSLNSVVSSLLGAINGLSEKIKSDCAILKGGALLSRAIKGIARIFTAEREDSPAIKMLVEEVIPTFVGDTLVGRGGVQDPYGDPADMGFGDKDSPLYEAVVAGSAHLVHLILEKAMKVTVHWPLFTAFRRGQEEIFNLLIQDEACLFDPVRQERMVMGLITNISEVEGASPSLIEKRRMMTHQFLDRWTSEVDALWLDSQGIQVYRTVDSAIAFEEVDTAFFLLSRGCKLQLKEETVTVDGRTGTIIPTVFTAILAALKRPCLTLVKRLVSLGVLDEWTSSGFAEDNDTLKLPCLLGVVARSIYCAYGGYPLRPENMEIVDIFLSRGFKLSWDMDDANGFLSALWDGEKLILDEDQAIELLTKLHSAGIDVIHFEKPGSALHSKLLVHAAAASGYNRLLDFAVALQGLEALEAVWQISGALRFNPLTAAVCFRKTSTVYHLLRHYHVRGTYDDFLADEQPIMRTLGTFSDDEAGPIVEELINSGAPLLMAPCFRAIGRSQPLLACAVRNQPRCMKLLLESELEGVDNLVNRLNKQPVDAKRLIGLGGGSFLWTVGQFAASHSYWSLLELILSRPSVSVLSTGTIIDSKGEKYIDAPSILQSAEASAARGGPGAPSRALLAVVRARAEAEKTAGVDVKTALSADGTSNAFEDPQVRVLSEKEEKRKAKKKAAKIKAKQKKEAAKKEADRGAGQPADGGESDSDSSGSDEEEAGMTAEEKMLARAPNFDLEKERAARKAKEEETKRAADKR